MATTIEVWPENYQAFEVFFAMFTQWRVSMSGPVGFDYGVLPEIWQRCQVAESDRDDAFHCLRVMEGTALKQIALNSK